MIIRIIKDFSKWRVGELVDVTKDLANDLIGKEIAELNDDQARLDAPPIDKKEEPPQEITVNNYYVVEPEEVKGKQKRSFFRNKK